MNITDQLAQALEECGREFRTYQRLNIANNGTGQQQAAMAEKCEKLVAAYRASKEGEKVEYRILSIGEVIELGDEWKNLVGDWVPTGLCIGRHVSVPNKVRRPIRATWQDETAQRLADNYKAAAESGNLPEVP